MSKELEALEYVKNFRRGFTFTAISDTGKIKDYNYKTIGEAFSKEFDIIETALKEKEQQDSVLKILKEVIKFSQMLPRIEPNKDNGFDIMSAVSIKIQRDIENKERELLRQWVLKECFPKELKALEIIKRELKYNVDFVDASDFRAYIDGMICCDNKEEFDLLKEVLR